MLLAAVAKFLAFWFAEQKLPIEAFPDAEDYAFTRKMKLQQITTRFKLKHKHG